MANWVKNILCCRCSPMRFEQVMEFVRGDDTEDNADFDFEKIKPTPKELLEVTEGMNGYFKGFYIRHVCAHQAVRPLHGIPFPDDPINMNRIELMDICRKIDAAEFQHLDGQLDFLCETEISPKDYSDPEIQIDICRRALHIGWMYFRNRNLYECESWYEWRLQNWGTKWNCCITSVDKEKQEFIFETANDAPITLLELLSILFPDVIFVLMYADENLGYNCNKVKIKNGKLYIYADYSAVQGSDVARSFAINIWGLTEEDLAETEDKEEK